MPLPTVNDVQAVEQVLTNMLVGYKQDQSRFVADRVFPVIPVNKDSGTFYKFTKKYWFRNEMEGRSPGQRFPRADFGVTTDTYSTEQFALENPIADEIRANSQVPMDLEEAAVQWLGQQSLLNKEIKFAADFMKAGVWSNDDTTATDWDDFQSGDPVDDILTARRTISNETGMDANTMVVGYIVHQALVNHPDILDRVKYTQSATLAGMEQALASVLGLENYLVAKASYSNTNESASFSASAIIDDDALVCHVTSNPGMFNPSSGKTFAWTGGGGNGTIYRVRDNKAHADLIQIKEQWDQKAVATDLGYFFSGIV